MNGSKGLGAIYDALNGLDKALGEDESLINDFSSKEQLVKFRQCLLRVLRELNEGVIPPGNKRSLGIAMIVVNCWPFDFYLGPLLIEAERVYKEWR